MLRLSYCETRSEETGGRMISIRIAILHPRPASILQMVARVKRGDHVQRSPAISRNYVFLPSEPTNESRATPSSRGGVGAKEMWWAHFWL